MIKELTLSKFQIARLVKDKVVSVQKNGTKYELRPRVPAAKKREEARAKRYREWLAKYSNGTNGHIPRRRSRRVECPKCGKLVKKRGLLKHTNIVHEKKYVPNIQKFYNAKRKTA